MKKFNHILLVDDDKISNRIAEKLIARLGIANHVTTVSNGKDAIGFLKLTSQIPEVIFLDLNMPVMDGYEFLEIFNSNEDLRLKTDIVILTSSTASRDLHRIQQFNIKFYLSKPLLDSNLVRICEIIQAEKQPRFVMLGS